MHDPEMRTHDSETTLNEEALLAWKSSRGSPGELRQRVGCIGDGGPPTFGIVITLRISEGSTGTVETRARTNDEIMPKCCRDTRDRSSATRADE